MLSPLRQGRLTGSRIGVLMNGTADEVRKLYHIVRGEQPEDDLSRVWAVQLGIVTTDLNLDWYAYVTGNPVTRREEFVPHPIIDWAGVTLDGYDENMRLPVEAKYVGGYEPLETIINRYQPQCQLQIECTGAMQCALSMIMGGSSPVVEYLPREHAYIEEMLKRGAQFMWHVERGIIPVDIPEPAPPPPPPWKSVVMDGNNMWADFAATWLANREAAERCEEAAKGIKEMVVEDVRIARGHGVIVKRDRAGRKSLRPIDD